MRNVFVTCLITALLWAAVMAGDKVTDGKIKVFLFANAAFFGESSVDAYHDTCLSLDNNLVDGNVRSILVGGREVSEVMNRDDYWYCTFYDNYSCEGNDTNQLVFADGVNNLGSVGWGTRIHSLKCANETR